MNRYECRKTDNQPLIP